MRTRRHRRDRAPNPVPEGARACYTGRMRMPRLSAALSLLAPAGMLVSGLLLLADPAGARSNTKVEATSYSSGTTTARPARWRPKDEAACGGCDAI